MRTATEGIVEAALQDVLHRHVAFWECAEVDRPLLHVSSVTPPADRAEEDETEKEAAAYLLLDGSRASDGMRMEPGMIDMADGQTLGEDRRLNVLDGDYVASWGPSAFSSFPWMEAISGCPVFHSAGTCWTRPLAGDWTQRKNGGGWRDSPWFEELLAVNRLMVEAARGQMGVAQPLFRGPFDVATAAIGGGELCMEVIDRPRELEGFMGYCADVYVDVARRRLDETPAFEGGYFPFMPWGLWAPGPTVRYQADNSHMISPRMYRERFMPFDRRVAQTFEYSAFATHTTQAVHLPVYAEIPELRAIEMTIEIPPFGRPPLELLPQFREVQAMGKALMLTGVVTRPELDGLLEGLSPRGLALRVSIREER